MRYTPAGKPFTRISLAVNRMWANDRGEKQVDTTWLRVTVWGKQAEACSQYLSKGRMVLVEARQTKASAYLNRDKAGRAGVDPNGTAPARPALTTLELVARNVRFLGGNGSGNGHNGTSGSEQPVEEEAEPEL